MQGQKSLPWGERSTGEEVAQAEGRHVHCSDDAKCSGTPSGGCVVGRCWEACSSWARCHWSLLKVRWIDSIAYLHYFPKEDAKRQT